VDAARSWASAVAIKDGRIVYVGSDSLPPGLIGPATRTADLQGKMVLPGFQDGHVHPIDAGVDLGECTLDDLTTPKAVADSIRACARGKGRLRARPAGIELRRLAARVVLLG
jgi:predicted amidohydrolase YtcJ